MNVFDAKVGTVTGILGGCLHFLFGGWDILIQVLLALTILDIITGYLAAIYKGNLTSKRSWKGGIKKIAIYSVVALACVVSPVIEGGTPLPDGILRTAIIWYFIGTEGLSIVENAALMDVIVPQFLKDKLEVIKDNKGSV